MDKFHKLVGGCLIVLGMLALLAGVIPVRAQDAGSVQLLTGRLNISETRIFSVPGLLEGETLQIYARGISGNLDPFIGITDYPVEDETIRADFTDKVWQVIDEGGDPVEALPEIAGEIHVSHNTVKTHVQNIYRKLGTRTRTETVERARSEGLLA